MSEMENLKKRVAELERIVEALKKEFCPPTVTESEVDDLVQRLGPDGAAEEINRRYRLRKAV